MARNGGDWGRMMNNAAYGTSMNGMRRHGQRGHDGSHSSAVRKRSRGRKLLIAIAILVALIAAIVILRLIT